MAVHSGLGPGLREKPCEKALALELKHSGFGVEVQRPFPILYRNQIVGDCIPDITIDQAIIVEAKSVDQIGKNEIAQILNYLRISRIEIGLIVNFKNPKMEWKRVVKER